MATPRWRLTPLPLRDVAFTGGFLAQRQKVNRQATIYHAYEQLKKTGRLDAFRLKWKPGKGDPPHIFWDSDVAKWLEAASYILTTNRSRKLRKLVDDIVDLIVASQQPDGYINVHFTVVEPEKRWTNLRDWHELYCAGHLMEAAVAHHEATGERKFLEALSRFADHIASIFGPGKKRGYPGHEEIELALVKLYRATANPRYLKLSKFFIDERGRRPHYFDKEARARGEDPRRYWPGSYEYCQAHKPVREQAEAVGHSVRAMYLYSGMADIAAETGDEALLAACRRLWESVTARRMYVTGGVGSAHHGERFTGDYDLPNASAYAETCAAIGLVFFAHRMLQIEADARYGDVMERALYNGVLSGLSLDGKGFFYVNPLASAGNHHRRPWFGCACCPPNLARLVASLGRYAYSSGDHSLYVHLYAEGRAKAAIAGQTVSLTQRTDYPWDGLVELSVGTRRPVDFALALRIPAWARKWELRVNGRKASPPVRKGYAIIKRTWQDGDAVTLELPMPVERIVAHPLVAEDVGRVALQRGPVVFCLEDCDHRAPARSIILPDRAKLTSRLDRKLLGGCAVVEGQALAPSTAGWAGKLYRPLQDEKVRPVRMRAIPYCLWDNRSGGAMTVWLSRREAVVGAGRRGQGRK